MRTPISEHLRLSSIGTLRGFALLGILVMNIQSFAMISAAYTFPNLHMDISGVNLVVWTLSHVFAHLKFMAIFSMLFGAGVILATQRRDQAGQRTWTYHYARTFWLRIFGMAVAIADIFQISTDAKIDVIRCVFSIDAPSENTYPNAYARL